MTLANKYIRYSPEITFEIFKLVWDKLIESGFKSRYNNKLYSEFDCFKGKHNYFIIDDICFNTHMSLYIINGLETTVQEILGYDPFVKDKVIPEYVECIGLSESKVQGWSNHYTIGNVYKLNSKPDYNFTYIVGDDNEEWACDYSQFKPSTKEAFDAQNRQKSIEKWSVGSYVVFLKDFMHINTGYIDVIKETLENNCVYLEKYLTMDIGRERSGEVKWFAAKSEAEEFAKTLVEPVKKEFKQPSKQAVHCKTQEEWDFVTEKLGYKWSKYSEWSSYKNNTCIGLNKLGFGTADLGYKGHQILSFQEWCDLNGYKMETNIDLTGRHLRALIDGPQSTIYKKGDIVDIFKKESSNQYRIGKVGDGWWTYTTNNETESQWELLPEDYKVEKKAKFEVGDYVVLENAGGWSYSTCNDGCLGLITKIGNFKPSTVTDYICSISGNILNSNNKDTTFRDIPIAFYHRKWIVRHATPEEINNHLISIGQIPAGEPLNIGIKPDKDGMFKYKQTMPGASWSGGTIDNHLDVMIQSKTQSEIEFNYLPEPK